MSRRYPPRSRIAEFSPAPGFDRCCRMPIAGDAWMQTGWLELTWTLIGDAMAGRQAIRQPIPRGLIEIINALLLSKVKFERVAGHPPRARKSRHKKIRRRRPSGRVLLAVCVYFSLDCRLDRSCRGRQRADAGAGGVEDRVRDRG